MQYSLAFHIIGVVLWVGGLVIVSRYLTLFTNQESSSEDLAALINRTWKGYVLPGFMLALLTGLHQLFAGGVGEYMKQGWFHGKMTLLIVLFVMTFLMGKNVSKAAKGEVLSRGKLGMLHGVSALCLILIVLLTKALRF